MSKNAWRYHCYRRPHVHQEMVANCELREEGEVEKWGRGGRKMHDLDPWITEQSHGSQKNWKKRRKTQYREAGARNNKHKIYVVEWREKWNLEKYFKDKDIPFRIQEHTELYTYKRVEDTQYVLSGYSPYYGWKNDQIQRGWKEVWKEIKLEVPIITYRKCRRTIGYTFTYWTEKSLDLEKIIKDGC